MDIFTKGALWDYWKMGGDEIEVCDDESSDLEEYWSDKEETAKNFKIETDVFYYETPLCLAFNEYNYLLKVDLDLLTKDIIGFKTYKDYKDDWIYEWNKNVPWDGYCNGGNLPGAYHIGNSLHYQDLEWYEALEDSELKDEALRNKAIMEGLISDDESSNDLIEKREDHSYTTTIMMKENVKTKLMKKDDLGSKEISTNIGGEFTNLEILKCWSLETSRRLFNTNLANKLNMENLPSKYQGSFSF
ncbi:hypothetical protein Tco_1354880 [Tanacetum coccineum]